MTEKLRTWSTDNITCTWCAKPIQKGDTVYLYVSANDQPFPNTVTHVDCISDFSRPEERIAILARRWRAAQLYRGWFE